MQTTTDRTLLPYLFYVDPASAIDWLARAFGFNERFRLTAPNGAIAHAEVEMNDGVVMIGNVGGPNRTRPKSVRSAVYVFVQDVDAHCATARDAGAEIVSEPADQPFGDRLYVALDSEGHEWYFAQHMRDVDTEALQRQILGGPPGP